MKKADNIRRLTLGAMLAALSFVIIYVGRMTGVLDMSASVICGLITLMLLRECGRGLTATAIVSCGVLCFILIPDPTVGVLYLTVAGIYPFVKPYAERCRPVVSWSIKITVSAVIILAYVGAIYLFIPSEAGRFIIPIGLAFGVPCFILYDFLLTRFAVIYERRLRLMLWKKR